MGAPPAAARPRAPPGTGGVFKSAAAAVLGAEGRLMTTGDITKLAVDAGLLVNSNGRTQEASMASALYTDVKRRGGASAFARHGGGLFGLREWLGGGGGAAAPPDDEPDAPPRPPASDDGSPLPSLPPLAPDDDALDWAALCAPPLCPPPSTPPDLTVWSAAAAFTPPLAGRDAPPLHAPSPGSLSFSLDGGCGSECGGGWPSLPLAAGALRRAARDRAPASPPPSRLVPVASPPPRPAAAAVASASPADPLEAEAAALVDAVLAVGPARGSVPSSPPPYRPPSAAARLEDAARTLSASLGDTHPHVGKAWLLAARAHGVGAPASAAADPASAAGGAALARALGNHTPTMSHLIPRRRPPARADWPYVPDRGVCGVAADDARDVLGWAGTWLAASTGESNLTAMFDSDMMAHVANRTSSYLRSVFRPAVGSDAPPAAAEARARRVALAKQLYCAILKHALGAAAAAGATPDALRAAVESPRLAEGALAAAAEVAAYACAPPARGRALVFPALAAHAALLAPPFALWTALPDVAAALAAANPAPPPGVMALLDVAAVRLEEQLVWEAGSDVYAVITAVGTGAGACGGADVEEALEALLRNVADRAAERARAAGAALVAAGRPPLPPAFPDGVADVAYSVAAGHLACLYGQHLSVVVAAAVYGAARARGAALQLAAVARAVAGAAPHAAAVLAAPDAAELEPATPTKACVRGDVRAFYNGPFLAAARPLLLGERAAAGAGAGSPSASPAAGGGGDRAAPSPKLSRVPLATLTAADMAARHGGGVTVRRGGAARVSRLQRQR